MSEKITVYLPPATADKLYALRSDPAEVNLVARLEAYLANLAFSGVKFALAPPITTMVGGSPLMQLHEVRVSIGILTSRIIDLLVGADPAAELLVDALTAHRLQFERDEEAIIVAALANGLAVDRRPHTDPAAILGIVEIMPAETAAAA